MKYNEYTEVGKYIMKEETFFIRTTYTNFDVGTFAGLKNRRLFDSSSSPLANKLDFSVAGGVKNTYSYSKSLLFGIKLSLKVQHRH